MKNLTAESIEDIFSEEYSKSSSKYLTSSSTSFKDAIRNNLYCKIDRFLQDNEFGVITVHQLNNLVKKSLKIFNIDLDFDEYKYNNEVDQLLYILEIIKKTDMDKEASEYYNRYYK